MRKNMLVLLLLIALLAMAMTGCGAEKAAETTQTPAQAETDAAAPQVLGLTGWSMNATTWSSPNGATVHLNATPSGYAEGQSAVFSVRMEGEEVASAPCQWDGSAYTASVDLNAEDGYCYYVLLTGTDGAQTEVAVNTPAAPSDESLINLAAALNAYCSVTVNTSELDGGELHITDGEAKLQLPQLTLAEGAITCDQAVLILSYNGEDVALEKLPAFEADETGLASQSIAGIRFSVPSDIEDDHQLSVRMEATLSNGHTLSASGGTWMYLDGNLVLAVG